MNLYPTSTSSLLKHTMIGMTFLASIAFVPRQSAALIVFSDFATTTGLNLVGDATQFNNRLRLTPAESGKVGGAWIDAKQLVAEGFRTTFAFEVAEPDPDFGADGFAFIIQNVSSTALGVGGSSLGFMDIGDGPGLENFLAVEFDTLNSGITFDTNDNHIAVQAKNSSTAREFLGSATPPFSIQDGGVHTAQITYTPGTLRVAVDGATTPLLQVNVDINSLLGLSDGTAWIGFTGATGGAWETHDIVNWTFASVPEPAAASLVLIGALALTSAFRHRPKYCR